MRKILFILLMMFVFFNKIEVKADLTSIQEENIKKFTIKFVEEGLSKIDNNGYPLFAYMQGQARIDGYNGILYYVNKDYQGINTVKSNKWTFDCSSFVSYIYKHVFNLTLTGAYRLNPYLVSDFVSDADNNRNFYYVQKNVKANTIDYNKMKPGDLIVIKGSHIMFYLGDERFAHASSSAINSSKKLGIEFNNLSNKYPDMTFYVIRIKDNVISESNAGNMKVTWPDTGLTSDYSLVLDKPTIETSLSTTAWTKSLTINMNFKDQDGLEGYSVSKVSTPSYSKITGKSASATYEVTQNGVYYINVIDVINNVTSKEITINNIDNTSPTISSFVYKDGYLFVEANDKESGLDSKAYSFDNGEWNNVNKKEISANGTYSVRVRDKVGNIVTKTIRVDNYMASINDKPTITTSLSNTGWTNNLFINMTFNDQDGLKGFSISKSNNQNYTTIEGKSITKKYEVKENGTYYINVIDINGNVTSKEITINNIDNTNPIISSFIHKDGYLIVEANDKESGLDSKAYSFDNGEWNSVNRRHVNANGTYSVRVRDKVGNIVTKTIEVSDYSISINDKPTITTSFSSTGWTKGLFINMTFNDQDGLKGFSVSKSRSQNYTPITGNVINEKYEVKENGTYYINVIDINNNVTNKIITINNIDNTSPEIVSLIYDRGYLFVDATDKESGLDIKAYSFDNGEWTNVNKKEINFNGVYTVRVRDILGNVTNKSITVTNYEKPKNNDKPLINVINMNTAWSTKVTIKINIIDYDGLSEYSVVRTDIPDYIKVNTIRDYTKEYSITENGVYYIYAKDILGNVTSKKITISNIDNIKPKINSLTHNNGVIEVLASDNESGLAMNAYSFNGGKWTNNNTFSVVESGIYKVRICDKVGNIIESSIEIELNKTKLLKVKDHVIKDGKVTINIESSNKLLGYYFSDKNILPEVPSWNFDFQDNITFIPYEGKNYVWVIDSENNISNVFEFNYSGNNYNNDLVIYIILGLILLLLVSLFIYFKKKKKLYK